MEMSDQPAPADGGEGPQKLRLKVASGNAAGTVIEVEDELVIGRQAAGAGSLGNDIEISRQHARIASDADGRYLIEDLGSTNGTYVNGRVVEAPVPLETGDRIELGASALIVQVSAPAPTPRSTPVTTTSALPEPEALAGTDAGIPQPQTEPGPEAGEPGPSVESARGLPPLRLRIDFDVEGGEVTVAVDEGDAGEVKFVHEDGRWRLK